MVLTQSGQAETSTASHGSLKPAMEWKSHHHLWRVERLFSPLRCHFHRSSKGRWYVLFQILNYNTDKLTFNIPSIIRGEAPMRQFHTASVIDNQMYVFGGGDGKYWLNDLLVFDLVNLEWSGPVQTNGIAPVGRLQHSAITFEKKIYIFGGEPDQFR